MLFQENKTWFEKMCLDLLEDVAHLAAGQPNQTFSPPF